MGRRILFGTMSNSMRRTSWMRCLAMPAAHDGTLTTALTGLLYSDEGDVEFVSIRYGPCAVKQHGLCDPWGHQMFFGRCMDQACLMLACKLMLCVLGPQTQGPSLFLDVHPSECGVQSVVFFVSSASYSSWV